MKDIIQQRITEVSKCGGGGTVGEVFDTNEIDRSTKDKTVCYDRSQTLSTVM